MKINTRSAMMALTVVFALGVSAQEDKPVVTDGNASAEVVAEGEKSPGEGEANPRKPAAATPPVVHPSIGESVKFGNGKEVRLVDKLQNFTTGLKRPIDRDILSPKSVNVHPSGKKFYVNSLEGGKTIAYSLPGLEKLAVISHRFDDKDSDLWAPASGLFKFRHYTKNLNTFMGKPVESAFSHNGRYLWVPYYRRSFDLNAQDPSAVAIIDTETDKIIRIMEAGVLPKMVAVSPDGKTLALSHWGDNTVGLIDISSQNPTDWKYIANVAVGRQLFHNFSLTTSVDRDSNTGEALRGTIFTPDSRYLLVGCMSGGGIAVIDVKEKKYLGKILGTMPNLRHLVRKGDWVYVSINGAGYVQRIPLARIEETIKGMDGKGNRTLTGWESVKVAGGARTLELSPKGDYIFVACNSGSKLCIVDSTMNKVAELSADSYPVGLDVSPDGKWLITTSQGRKGGGGNCVDVFSLSGFEGTTMTVDGNESGSAANVETPVSDVKGTGSGTEAKMTTPIVIGASALLLGAGVAIVVRNRKKG